MKFDLPMWQGIGSSARIPRRWGITSSSETFQNLGTVCMLAALQNFEESFIDFLLGHRVPKKSGYEVGYGGSAAELRTNGQHSNGM